MRNIVRPIFSWMSSVLRIFSEEQRFNSWWVRITTQNPEFTYFFGPFESREIARRKLSGFVEDLQSENAYIVDSDVKWCDPPQPTVEGVYPIV